MRLGYQKIGAPFLLKDDLKAAVRTTSFDRGDTMRVGIVGGVERNQARYEEVARVVGCDVEFHHGHMRGRGPEALDAMIERCDLIVIVTEINSHCAVRMAQKFSRKRGRRVLIARKFGLHTFEQTARAARAELAAISSKQPRVTTRAAQVAFEDVSWAARSRG